MFQAQFQQCSLFRKMIDSMKQLVKNVNIDITPNGMSIQAIDVCHIALVSLRLKKQCFSHYNCVKPLTIGISIQNVSKILKIAGNDDSLMISCQYQDPSQLKFRFQSKRAQKITQFNLSLIVIDSQSMGIPETQYTSICSIPTSQYTRICKQFGNLSENIKIQTNKQKIRFSMVGEIGTGSTTLSPIQSQNQTISVSLDVDSPVIQNFASRYLSLFTRAGCLSNQVILNMSQNTPMMVNFQLPDGKGQLRYYIAPKITEDDL